MRRRIGLWICVASLAVASAGFAKGPIVKGVDQLVQEYPYNVKALFENEHIWVLEFLVKPGQFLPMHAAGDRAVYSLSDYELLCVESYEPCQQMYWKGDIYWLPDEAHAVRNVGETDAHFLVVARKGSALGKAQPVEPGMDLPQIAPDNTRVLLENNAMRVAQVVLHPGEKLPVHMGLHRVNYALTGFQLMMGSGEETYEIGRVTFQEPSAHEVENAGTTVARYLVFELKK